MFAEEDPTLGVIFIIEFPAPVFYIFKVGRKDKIKYLALNRFVVEAESVCTVRRRAVETLEGGRGEILTVSPPQLEERLPPVLTSVPLLTTHNSLLKTFKSIKTQNERENIKTSGGKL